MHALKIIVVVDDSRRTGEVGLSPGKHPCANEVLKLAKAQTFVEDVEVPSSNRNSNAGTFKKKAFFTI